MTDDLLYRLQVDARECWREAVAEIKGLRIERDAIAERADALYAELRDVCVGKTGCIACRVGWLVGEVERHIPGCLAAPSAPKEP